jgi:hypothetical protein
MSAIDTVPVLTVLITGWTSVTPRIKAKADDPL